MYTLGFSSKVPSILGRIVTKLQRFRHVSKNNEMRNFMKIRPVTADLVHAGGHVEANCRFS